MSSSSQLVESWIASFCSLLGNEYFAEVSEDFIEDDFNLTGLSSQVPHYKEALEMILDVDPEEDEEDEEEEEEEEDEDDDEMGDAAKPSAGYRRRTSAANDISQIENSAELLYGLIHQRYITSRPGIGQMHEKYDLGHFGSCPRVFCNGCKVLPVGTSDVPGQETVKLFCPSCLDIYTPPNSRFQRVDGAFFGTTFGCLFFMTFPELQVSPLANLHVSTPTTPAEETPQQQSAQALPGKAANQPTEINGIAAVNLAPGLGTGNIFEPKIYGFRVSERAKSGPRMRWLRSKPDDIRDLDEARRYHTAGDEMVTKEDDEELLSADEENNDDDGAADEDADEEEAAHGNNQAAAAAAVAAQQAQTQQQLDRRRRAPLRRRRRTGAAGAMPPPADEGNRMAMDANGIMDGVG